MQLKRIVSSDTQNTAFTIPNESEYALDVNQCEYTQTHSRTPYIRIYFVSDFQQNENTCKLCTYTYSHILSHASTINRNSTFSNKKERKNQNK